MTDALNTLMKICNSDDCPTIIHDAIQNVAALAFKSGGCHVIKPVMEDLEGKSLFVALVVGRFGNVIKDVQTLMFQMFKRNVKKKVLRSSMPRQI